MHAQDAIDLIVSRIGGLIDQVLGSNYDAWSAETALQTARCDEAVGEGVTLKLAEAFKCQHCLSCDALRRRRLPCSIHTDPAGCSRPLARSTRRSRARLREATFRLQSRQLARLRLS